MTAPADLYALPNLKAWLEDRGDPVADLYACPTCSRELEAAGIVDTTGLPGELPRWVCHVCASGPHRQALADQRAAPPPAADWSPDCELCNALRAERARRMAAERWRIDRHRDEVDMGGDTTLSPVQFAALLAYMQQLRDMTATPPDQWQFPDSPA